MASTVPVIVISTLPSPTSVAVAPGSVKSLPTSIVIALSPFRVITGVVVSITFTTLVAVDVLPGWHQVGYFPTAPALNPEPRSPKEKMMDNILRMGILDVYVEEGKEQEIVLNYQNLAQAVLAFQKSITAGSWVGFSLFFILLMLISWGV